MSRMKEVIAILLAVLFLVTVTAGAVSAVGPCSGKCKAINLHATAVNVEGFDTSHTTIMALKTREDHKALQFVDKYYILR